MTTVQSGLAILALGAAAAAAQGSGRAKPAEIAVRCAAERTWLAAEANSPGILRRLAEGALAACLAGAPQPVPVAGPAPGQGREGAGAGRRTGARLRNGPGARPMSRFPQGPSTGRLAV
jgi:hypothetical protein